jgi:clan AA aspartic protease
MSVTQVLKAMGQFTVKARIGAPGNSGQPQDVEFLVDTGAAFTWVPAEIADSVGLVPHDQRTVRVADGRQVQCGLTWARITLEGRTDLTLCLIGDRHTQPLLGAFTLEGFSLGVDSTNRRLIPVIPFVVQVIL